MTRCFGLQRDCPDGLADSSASARSESMETSATLGFRAFQGFGFKVYGSQNPKPSSSAKI